MNTNLDMDWTGNQGLSDSELMNIASGCGYDIKKLEELIRLNLGLTIKRLILYYQNQPKKKAVKIDI